MAQTPKPEKTNPSETKSSPKRPLKLVIPGALLAVIAALMSRFSGLFGFGQQPSANPPSSAVVTEKEDTAEAAPALPELNNDTQAATDQLPEIPDTIVIRIEQDQVTINDIPVTTPEELRQYIEEYNSDYRTFTLEEHLSLLETYNWVKDVFSSMDIELKNAK